MKPETALKTILMAGSLAILTNCSFSTKTKNQIKKRAEFKSELSGETENLECSHFNHSKTGDYNKPDNGLLVTATEHLAYHLMFRGCSHEIGLPEHQNEWAVQAIQTRANASDYEIEQAVERWHDYFSRQD